MCSLWRVCVCMCARASGASSGSESVTREGKPIESNQRDRLMISARFILAASSSRNIIIAVCFHKVRLREAQRGCFSCSAVEPES